jgi:type I restriction enzyme S subunit
MSEIRLPSEWLTTNLEIIGEVVTGKTPSKKNSDYFGGSIPFIKPGDVNDQGYVTFTDEHITELGATTVPTIPKESIVVTCIGNLGRCAITTERSATNQQINSVLANRNVDVKFIYFQMRTLKEWMISESSATTVTIINKSKFSQAPLVLPPLAEQKVIADKLDTLLAQVETTKARLERIPEILKSFRQSVLTAAVTGKLTEEWREETLNTQCLESIKQDMKSNRLIAWLIEQEKTCSRTSRFFDKEKLRAKYDEPSDEYQDEYDLTLISHIPESWLVTNLDNVSIAVTGKTPSTTDESNWGGEIPFISPTQILPAGTVEMPDRFVTEQGAQKIQLLPSGSVLIVCIGTIGKVGLLAMEAAFNQQINALIPTNSVLSKFLFYWAKTLHSWLNKTSSAVVNAAIINKSRLCSAPCPLPSIEEQAEIVRRVEQLFAFADSIEQKANAALARVNNLTQSILAKAFRGELTADWRAANLDLISGDNSAEALLTKIKTERAKLSQTKKSRSKTVEN